MTKYAIAFRATFGPNIHAKMEQLASQVVNVYRAQPGFCSAIYLRYDDEIGEYGSLMIFDSRESAVEAFSRFVGQAPQLYQQLGIPLPPRPDVNIVEIVELV
ncbi:MAG: hypothetical protein HY329_10915 [Chloroflexi bacterium]|nr:hypothetical protein [Chloroflexota bacterium]